MSTNFGTQFFLITEVSKLTGYSVPHLREMVDMGVVTPARATGGIRLFTGEDIGRLKARREHVMKYGRSS